jgi:hypothetical protein
MATKRPPSARNRTRRSASNPRQANPPLHDPRAIFLDACKPAPIEQEYIARKRGLPDSLRVYDGPLTIAGNACAGSLVLPCSTLAGELVTLQFITPQGKKLFLPGCKLPPDACLIVGGPLKPEGVVYIVEGGGQAWSAHQATRQPAVVCFRCRRMASVAKALRQRHEAARLVVVPDVGKEDQAAAIAKDVHGAWVELPPELGKNGDLNDLHQRDGLTAVAALLERTKEHAQRFRLLTPADLAALPAVRWRVRGVLPLEGIGAVFGPSGSGKSFLVLSLLASVCQWRRVVRLPSRARAGALRRT